jgi:hypothetical protein
MEVCQTHTSFTTRQSSKWNEGTLQYSSFNELDTILETWLQFFFSLALVQLWIILDP